MMDTNTMYSCFFKFKFPAHKAIYLATQAILADESLICTNTNLISLAHGIIINMMVSYKMCQFSKASYAYARACSQSRNKMDVHLPEGELCCAWTAKVKSLVVELHPGAF